MSNLSANRNINDVFGSEFVAELSVEKPVKENVISNETVVDKKEQKKQFIAQSVRLIKSRNVEGLKELYKKPRSFTINSRVLDIRLALLNCFDANVAAVLKEHDIQLHPNEVQEFLTTNFNKELFDYIEKDLTVLEKIHWINDILFDFLMGKDKGADSIVCLEHLYREDEKEFFHHYVKERSSFSPYRNILFLYNQNVPQRVKNFFEKYCDKEFLEKLFDNCVFKTNVLYCSDVGVSNMFDFLKDFPLAQHVFLEMNEKYSLEEKKNIDLIRGFVEKTNNQVIVDKYGCSVALNEFIQRGISEHNLTVLPRFHSILSQDLSKSLMVNDQLLFSEDYRKFRSLINRFASEAHNVLHILWKSEDGRQKFVESFNNELVRGSFFRNTSKELMKKVLRLPEFKGWKDEDGNTLLHYMVVFERNLGFNETMNILKIHCQHTEEKNNGGISVEELFLSRHNVHNEERIQEIHAELVKARLNKSVLPQKRTSDVAKKRKM